MLKKINKPLIIVLILAILLRLIGIDHGFPFINHPDEPSVIRSALGIRFFSNPAHFDWPHLYFYLNYFVYILFIKLRALLQIIGLRGSFETAFPILWRDPLVFYLLSRVLSAMLGAFTVVPVYLSSKELFGKTAALFAALAFALIPFHVWHSHYALIDVPMTFFASWAIYYSVKLYIKPYWQFYLFAGLFIGLAASTKYNGVLTVFVFLLGHLFRIYKSKEERFYDIRSVKLLVLAGLSSVAGLLFGTPYALLDYKTFIRTDGPKGALWQFTNVGKVDFPTHIKQFFDVVFYKISDDFGYTFLLIYFIVFAILLVKSLKRKNSLYLDVWLFVLPALFVIYYVSGLEKTRSHYFMPSYPYIAVLVGFAVTYFFKLFSKLHKLLVISIIVLMYLIPFSINVKNNIVLWREDTRNQLYSWMLENVNKSDLIIHNSTGLLPVLTKFEENEITRDVYITADGAKSGYIILALEDTELTTLYDEDNNYLQVINALDAELLEWYEPNYRNGPNILIYSFTSDESST